MSFLIRKYINLSNSNVNSIKDSVKSESYEGLIYIPKTSDFKLLENKIQYISNERNVHNHLIHEFNCLLYNSLSILYNFHFLISFTFFEILLC